MTETELSTTRSKRIYCNQCSGETNHVLHAEHKQRYQESEGLHLAYWEEATYGLWVCAGCDTGILEAAWTGSGMVGPDGEDIYTYTYYPPRSVDHLRAKQYKQLPSNLVPVYAECIKSFNAGLYLLCSAGLRALVEGICQDKSIAGRTLEKKIDGLNTLLPQNIVTCLHSFRFMGNDALHNLAPAQRKSLRLAIDVCEDLLNFLYELDYKAQQLPRNNKATAI